MILRSSICRTLLGLVACTFLLDGTDAALAAMSIDLGSEFIKIGIVKPGVPMEIVLNKESRRKTPNIVVIRNNERLFAETAAAVVDICKVLCLFQATKYPNSGYQYILSLLAKQKGDPSVELYQKRFPFTAFTFDEVRNTVVFPSDNATYNVETLLAMILWSAKQTTEAFAEQRVKDCVITVPIFFNQAERRALVAAADIAGLNLLQLINDGSAAALNYGVFRRKQITEKPQTMMIYDMGASKTTATIVEYVLEPDKSSKVSKTSNPVVKTIGVGYDRTLGGFEITLRMRDHLVKVLSANKYHYAQVEGLHEEQNFRSKVTREELEEMIVDLEPRFLQPINDALAMAEKTIDQIDQFVLMGAGTRVPKIQEVLKTILKEKEVGHFLNTDEAITLGAVYQAADLSKSFKVLPFAVKELVLFPIQVNFKSKSEDGNLKDVTRQIFGYKTHYPTNKKIVTFQSYSDDFESQKKKPLKAPVQPKAKTVKVHLNTSVNYEDLLDLNEEEMMLAKKILADFDHAEQEKHRHEEAMNALEGLVYDLAVKIEDGEEFAEFLTKEEKEKISEELKRLRTWMEDEAGIDTPTEDFISNKAILDELTAAGHNRKNERLHYPKMAETMSSLFNQSQTFFSFALNLTTTDDPVFTETEIEVLSKLINTTMEWWEEKSAAYDKQPKHEDPVVTIEEMATKIRDLDREVKYLINKMKNFKPKKKVEPKEPEKTNDTDTSSTPDNTTESVAEDSEKMEGKESNDTDAEEKKDEREEREHDPSEL
ncbi:hypothetical protein NECAME_00084 [Necator americanus]|uniref:Hypoxia up-regulated protein 1 n=1 Tax=Necator americanus TaxID=51031 RepID=W2TYS3_NECAM|nr:hypothetical protein NECAME_00084 [Necator americanus]ETN87225.1 hypothetical protein NECAME_00084 [Necator americanus]